MRKFALFAVCMVFAMGTALAETFTISSFHAPKSYVVSANGAVSGTLTDPVLFVEVQKDGKTIHRSSKCSIAGNAQDFYFEKKEFKLDAGKIVVKIYVGEDKGYERGMRAATGAGVCATIGGIIGGFTTGLLSGGFGAPAGAAIGAAIGAAVGGGGSQLLPIPDCREVASFEFDGIDSLKGTHTKECTSTDILSDGQEIKIVIE